MIFRCSFLFINLWKIQTRFYSLRVRSFSFIIYSLVFKGVLKSIYEKNVYFQMQNWFSQTHIFPRIQLKNWKRWRNSHHERRILKFRVLLHSKGIQKLKMSYGNVYRNLHLPRKNVSEPFDKRIFPVKKQQQKFNK